MATPIRTHHDPPARLKEPADVVRRPGGRAARVREAVLAATRDELTAGGYTALNAARIADRAGVHRSTVHRRWPDLDDLVTEALLDAAGAAIPVVDTGDFERDLRQLLSATAHYISQPAVRDQIRSLIADASRSPAIAHVVSRVWSSRFSLGEKIIEAAIARGELREDLAPATVLASFLGPLYLRVLFSHEALSDEFVDDIISLGLIGARSQKPSALRP